MASVPLHPHNDASALNADGSLKDVSKMEWPHSHQRIIANCSQNNYHHCQRHQTHLLAMPRALVIVKADSPSALPQTAPPSTQISDLLTTLTKMRYQQCQVLRRKSSPTTSRPNRLPSPLLIMRNDWGWATGYEDPETLSQPPAQKSPLLEHSELYL
jgi:hypothetical protein